jgi:alpha-mannosidase
MQVEAHAGALPLEHSFLALQGENVVLTAVKKAEDANGLIVRFYEWEGKDGAAEIRVPPGAVRASVTNLIEEDAGAPLSFSGPTTVKVPVHPFEITSVRIDYPHEEQ